jgi:TonB family protein
MKRFLPPLLALPLLVGACSSVSSSVYPSSAQLPTPPAVRTADLDTAWGKRPSYDHKGQHFYPVKQPRINFRNLPGSGTAVVDVLVNRDGTVQDLKLVTSSGNRQSDLLAVEVLRNSRYSLDLTPELPAPYVVREKFFINVTQVDAPSYDNGYNNGMIDTRGSPQSSNPGNSNTVNGFTR